MADRSVSIRLGTTGKADVTQAFNDIAASGEVSARRLTKSYERAGEDVEAAIRRQAAAAAKIAAITPQTATQMRITDANSTGFGQYEGSARRSAAAFAELLAAEEKLEARTRALVSAIDPAFAAQQRFDREMGEAKSLISAGTISLDQYCAKLRLEQATLDAAASAQGRAAISARGHGTALAAIAPQAQDAFTQIQMGTNVLSVLAIQGGQAAGQMAYLEGAAGKFGTFMMGPWGLAITGGLLLLGSLTNGLLSNKDAAEKAEAGMKKFQDRQSDIGSFIDATTGKLKEQNKTLVLNAILTRQAQIAENEKAITNGRNAAFKAAGNQLTRNPSYTASSVGAPIAIRETDPDVQRAIKEAGGNVDKLATSIAQLAATKRPDLKGLALDISTQAGQAIMATRENANLAKELRGLNGDTTALAKADTGLIDARAKLAGATTASDRAQAGYAVRVREIDAAWNASDKGAKAQQARLVAMAAAEHDLNVAQDANKKGGQAHAQSLARQAAAMDVSADAALDLARAYLVGGDAALKAEAARKGLTDATRKGIDGDAQVARQLAIMVGEQVAAGAKSVAQLREETAARAAVTAQVMSGGLPLDDTNQALSDEAALRPLLKLQMVAQGEALTILTRVIRDYRGALADAHAEEAKSKAVAASSAANDRAEEYRSVTADLKLSPLDQALNAANRSAVREADANHYAGAERKEFLRSRQDETQAQYAGDRARYLADALRTQQDSLTTAGAELRLVGAADDKRQTELEKLRLALDVRRRFPDLAQADLAALLQNVDAQAALVAQLHRQEAAWSEINDVGGSAIDKLFDTSSADSWGDRVKSILGDLQAELVKLALVNPLKNALFGQSNSTLSSVFSLFGGSKAGSFTLDTSILDAANASFSSSLKFASGTEYAPGGVALVGEHGEELVNLPQGSRVSSAAETRRLLATNDNGPGVTNHFDLRGAVVTQDLLNQMNAMASGAAVQGAAGGAAMSAADGQRSAARRLGRLR